jgi:hypothetical protein
VTDRHGRLGRTAGSRPCGDNRPSRPMPPSRMAEESALRAGFGQGSREAGEALAGGGYGHDPAHEGYAPEAFSQESAGQTEGAPSSCRSSAASNFAPSRGGPPGPPVSHARRAA